MLILMLYFSRKGLSCFAAYCLFTIRLGTVVFTRMADARLLRYLCLFVLGNSYYFSTLRNQIYFLHLISFQTVEVNFLFIIIIINYLLIKFFFCRYYIGLPVFFGLVGSPCIILGSVMYVATIYSGLTANR